MQNRQHNKMSPYMYLHVFTSAKSKLITTSMGRDAIHYGNKNWSQVAGVNDCRVLLLGTDDKLSSNELKVVGLNNIIY